MNCAFTPADGCDEQGRPRRACVRAWCRNQVFTHDPPEKCRAECKGWPSLDELGNCLELLLAACFITKRSWSWLWRKPCGCAARQSAMNQIGRESYERGYRIGIAIRRALRLPRWWSRRLGRWLYRVMVNRHRL